MCTNSLGGPVMVNAVWYCVPTPAGCPPPRPHLGDPCAQPGLDCNYGACSGGVDVVCKSGFWQEQLTACPAAAGH
jgi:hypothetical protein